MVKVYRYLMMLLIALPVFGQENNYPEHFGDIFKSDKFLLGKRIITGDVGLSTAKISFINEEATLTEFYRVASKINLNINPFKDFYIKNTFYFDLISYDEAPLWLSNHFYQIGVYNWRPNTFSYGYENYQPNRFNNAQFDYWTNMKRGLFFVSYKFEMSKERYANSPFFFDTSSRFIFVPSFRIQPEFVDINNETIGYAKPIIGTALRYVVYKNIYIETGLFYYPVEESKLPWDPDYTYGFGIFDWQAFKVNFSYGNWIANRFPWSDSEMKHGFMNGEFTLSFNYAW